MPVINRKFFKPKNVAKAQYTVVKPVQNLHIGGVKIRQWQVLTLSAPMAKHWLHEGILQAGVVAAPAAAPTVATAATVPTAASTGAGSATTSATAASTPTQAS